MRHEPPGKVLSRREDAPEHVLIVVVDALRPDFVPDIGIEFDHAITSAPWTFPSVTSMHTGLRPSDHGSVAHTKPSDEEFAMPVQTESYPHLPLDLEAAGYETYAGCGFVTPFTALQGWYQTHKCYDDENARRLINDYLRWRDGRESTAGYLHLGDLHAPVAPPEAYTTKHDVDLTLPGIQNILRYRTDFDHDDPECQYYREQKLKLHRAALQYVSDQLRPLLSGVREDTLVVVTGDHGEGLWEHQEEDSEITDSRPNHCFGHGGTPFDVIARVPLAVSSPNDSLSNPDGGWPVLRDLPKTILENILESTDAPGRDWNETIPDDRAVICEGTRYGVERKAIYCGEYKLIRSEADDVTLTAEIADGEERFGELPESVVESLAAELPNDWDTLGTKGSVTDFTQSRLEALGYR